MAVRLAGLLAKELIQFFRDRVMLVLILWLYTVEVVICTVALSFAVRDLPLALVDLDHSPASRALATAFGAGDAFRVTARPARETHATAALQAGTARAALIIPEDFARRLARGEPAEVQLLVDGSNSTVAAQARAYALEIVQDQAQDRARDQAYRLAGPTARPPLRVALRSWYNPAADLERFTVLSMIALAALMVGVIHPAASIVREREIGTLEQLRVSRAHPPCGSAHIVLCLLTEPRYRVNRHDTMHHA